MKKIFYFLCKFLGWHSPKKEMIFDGVSFQSRCKHCDKKIIKDSQGNWF